MTDESRGDLGGFDADELGRSVRRLAVEAHWVLRRPDSPIDEVIDLHRRVWALLQDAKVARSRGIRRWLLATRRVIAARLHRWAAEELESLVA